MVLPNQLTVLRIILTPVFLFLFISDEPLLKQLSLAVFIVAAVTDWYDGWLARKFNYITNWGKFMDPLADKILTSTAFFAFVFLGVLQLWMVVVIVFRDFMVTFLRLYADTKGESMSTSYMAKWKTFIQMAFIYYLLAVDTLQTVGWIYRGNESVFRMLMNPELIYICMLVITILTIYTGVAYLFTNRKLFLRFFPNEK
ncbi:MAG: CDP-diacylglycerol--glycerol-3-phosphate 3-phosphatidyltransferase [Ignavibacteria bacterium]|jgi:CDP-diacylglycerol--glycerol-3-phosphate 3-phosphatidyltransferase|nr:CDP-diacylglycerol--glycerol-3-phosphate 3-phosphatidyltransferase [Ignavibacteria bacterium]MCU7505096.1 CDP-diacylglycerol--glycerol-3-phosphate 3-phosphatidyltransferase [Ignavibacteria bacterium]MCU7518072.1 CDP-diacylglycerol--glycerol-3-phosphate 3-phosphatidyltransferase [Ignavibacteria bacterium]